MSRTSRPHAPWHAIPADNKTFLRMAVGELMAATLERPNLRYPKVAAGERKQFAKLQKLLEEDR